jgi:hypothetical protein
MTRVIVVAIARRLIGFALVAAGVSITFLNVSADINGYNVSTGRFENHAACGSVWRAMLSNSENNPEPECDVAALPQLWIAGGVAAISRRRVLGSGLSSASGDGWARLASHIVDHRRRVAAVLPTDGRIGAPPVSAQGA